MCWWVIAIAFLWPILFALIRPVTIYLAFKAEEQEKRKRSNRAVGRTPIVPGDKDDEKERE